MEERDRMQIEKYFAHELTAQEKITMEQRLTSDTEFAIEFESYRQAVEALRLAQREELKNRFRERDRILDKKENPSTGRNRYFFLLAAALVVMLVGLWVLNNIKGPQADINIAVPQDTLKTQEVSKAVQDSVSREEKIPMASNEEKDENKWKEGEVNGEALFAANFEPYMDESMDPTSRSDVEDMTDYEKFEYYYWEGDHANVVKVFNSLDTAYRKNDNLKFLYANALIATKRIKEAGTIMKEVMQNKKSLYQTEAIYYVALINIHQEKFDEAKKNLQRYLQDSNAQKRDKAQEILDKLK